MNSKQTILAIRVLGAVGVVAAALTAYLSSGQPLTISGALLAVGGALLGWAQRTPGVLAPADAGADEPARDASASMYDDGEQL